MGQCRSRGQEVQKESGALGHGGQRMVDARPALLLRWPVEHGEGCGVFVVAEPLGSYGGGTQAGATARGSFHSAQAGATTTE